VIAFPSALEPAPVNTARAARKALLVGLPNVGKSVLFNRLTGRYVTVSNYPGTTVEVSRGSASLDGSTWEIVDTPGLYSLNPLTDDERVTRLLLLQERADAVIHVCEAAALERSLPMTLELIEAGFPVLLVVNMMDEARRRGLEIDTALLEKELRIPVIPAVGIKGGGVELLKRRLHERR
jgi:ferrous iron transport protein B